MTDSLPVSVIIPAFNAGAFLVEAVESLLCQSRPPSEILIIDDGSEEPAERLLRKLDWPGLRCLRQPNRGPAAARNRGLDLAREEIIGFLDADDLWRRDLLPKQLNLLLEEPEVVIVKGLTQILEQAAETGPFRPSGKPFLFGNLGGTLYRRSVFENVGRLDPSLRFSEDLDWLLKAREQGVRIRILDEVTQYHRRHGANMTARRPPEEMSMLQVMKRAIDRKRQAAGRGRES